MSGEQNQRIQLVQAVYNDADIYLLDGLFSAVDAHTVATLFNDVYEKQKALVLTGEIILLATIDSDFIIKHPYKALIAALKKLGIFDSIVAKVAYKFVNEWLRTTLCLQNEPQYIAVGSIYLTAKRCEVKLPSERGKFWWLEFDVSLHQLEEILKEMLRLLEENTFSSDEKVTRAAHVTNATSSSPQSCVLKGCGGISESMKAGVGGKSRQSSAVRNGKVSPCQTSTFESSRSVVEDGNTTDDGDVKPRLEGSNQKTACKIVSDCSDSDHIKEAWRKRKYENAITRDNCSWK